jgi:hypothetical protein
MMYRPASASLLVLVAALTLVGCGGLGPGRTPSGTTATSRIDAAGVTRLDVASGFDVRVSLGQPEAVTFGQLPWSSARLTALVVAFVGSAALWWIYFNRSAEDGRA